jgi:probable rRNA maturation factor
VKRANAGKRAVQVQTANRQSRPVNAARLAVVVRQVLEAERAGPAEISLAIVDDPTIHELNRRYLDHDWPTDVLSFDLSDEGGPLSGEIVVSADTAAAGAERFGWSLDEELLLCVVHGALHLAGYDDRSKKKRRAMREREREHLEAFGLTPRYHDVSDDEARARQLPAEDGGRRAEGGRMTARLPPSRRGISDASEEVSGDGTGEEGDAA